MYHYLQMSVQLDETNSKIAKKIRERYLRNSRCCFEDVSDVSFYNCLEGLSVSKLYDNYRVARRDKNAACARKRDLGM